jgi:hypothetical protein
MAGGANPSIRPLTGRASLRTRWRLFRAVPAVGAFADE